MTGPRHPAGDSLTSRISSHCITGGKSMIKFGGPISTFKTENVKSEADGFSALQSHNPVFKAKEKARSRENSCHPRIQT